MKKIPLFVFQLVFLCSVVLLAQEKPKPPVVTDAHQKEFFKHQSQLIQIQSQLAQAQQAVQNAAAAMQKDCGEKYVLQLDQKTGDAICVEKPADSKK
jgi:hypothetical protein